MFLGHNFELIYHSVFYENLSLTYSAQRFRHELGMVCALKETILPSNGLSLKHSKCAVFQTQLIISPLESAPHSPRVHHPSLQC